MSVKVAVIGAGGSIGSELVKFLFQYIADVQVLALGRSTTSLRRVYETCGKKCIAHSFDVTNTSALKTLLQQCDIVCNCAGPSSMIEGSVARECLMAGVPYIDPSDFAFHAVQKEFSGQKEPYLALFGAGLVPGLSGIFSRWGWQQLVTRYDEPKRFDVYYAGKDIFSESAAFDYVVSIRSSEPPDLSLPVPHFQEIPGSGQTFLAFPYISSEIQKIKSSLSAPLVYYNCFIGEEMLRTLGIIGRQQDISLSQAAKILRDASIHCTDNYGKGHFFFGKLEMNSGEVKELSINIDDANIIMGTIIGITVITILQENLQGIHYLSEIIHPDKIINKLIDYNLIHIIANSKEEL